jgi:hypothetical protein
MSCDEMRELIMKMGSILNKEKKKDEEAMRLAAMN